MIIIETSIWCPWSVFKLGKSVSQKHLFLNTDLFQKATGKERKPKGVLSEILTLVAVKHLLVEM